MQRPLEYISDIQHDNYLTITNCNDRMLGDRLHTTRRENGRPDFGVQYLAEVALSMYLKAIQAFPPIIFSLK
ncbi:MAG: hypothetical protein E7562_02865 [Ruminococcaceae bacterium]|nr:hypothetical protein [Oscillospiraceae bacterium]